MPALCENWLNEMGFLTEIINIFHLCNYDNTDFVIDTLICYVD
jgi:hypothetical protein